MKVVAAAVVGTVIGLGALWMWPESEAEKAERIAKEQARAQYEAERKQKGFHCLSAWDGSNFNVEYALKKSLRDPDSYKHIETRISPLNEKTGKHTLLMQYRARNGFGGYTTGVVYAELNNECNVLKIKNLA